MSITLVGRCHCGEVSFEVDFPDGIGPLNRCNCSMCRKKGAVMTSVPLTDFRLVTGAEKLSLYQWNTQVAKHYFCRDCGIYTHHRRRSAPDRYAINVGCLDIADEILGREIGMLNGAANSVVK